MKHSTMMLVVAGLLGSGGCGTATAKATRLPLPRERADECRANCAALGMELGAMVIIMNSAGCVCQPPQAPGPPRAASAGGVAAAVIAVVTQRQAAAQAGTAAAARQRGFH